jgi:hypothetical protein
MHEHVKTDVGNGIPGLTDRAPTSRLGVNVYHPMDRMRKSTEQAAIDVIRF